MATITSIPKEGQVFNNALTRKDAGNVDRMQGILDAVFAAAGELACCLDVALTEADTPSAVVMTTWRVGADGHAEAFTIDGERSDVAHPVMAECLASVVIDLEFPPSPTNKATSVELPLHATTKPSDP